MRCVDIIEKKKRGEELSRDEIAYFVEGYTLGTIPDYQASALAMAIYFNKMTEEETAALTLEMAKSGDILDLSRFGDKSVDKHSSGGVGDKTTLVVAPIAAAAGCTVAKMSGRGLGFTGGTIDKLESIPGFSTKMTPLEFFERAEIHDIVIAGQTGNMAPCDKKLYALRDVTATVDCMPLIASSIMSKKIAAGAKNIVLDVKCGHGAFMQNIDDATQLASEMVNIGKHCGRRVTALITDMNSPLGYAVGNSLEVREAIKILKGEKVDGLSELCIALAANMISLALDTNIETATKIANEMISSGKALDKLREAVISQGGDASYIDNEEKFGFDDCKLDIFASESGYIGEINALATGEASVLLGAGRNVKEDEIDSKAGILFACKVGDEIKKGDRIMTLYAASDEKIDSAKEIAEKAVKITAKRPPKSNIILKQID